MSYAQIARSQAHRPYPLPAGSPVGYQSWRHLLFAHWPVPPAAVHALLPAGMELDTFGADAWISVVPFQMAGVRPRFAPAVPGLSCFNELNVRTYVRHRGQAGVYFFSLDAGSPVAVALGRRFFALPYLRAQMQLQHGGDGSIEYRSLRTDGRAPAAQFSGHYRGIGRPLDLAADSLETWLTERYFFLSAMPSGQLLRAEVHHLRWPLVAAEASLDAHRLVAAAGLQLPDTPPASLQFTARIDVMAWLPKRV